VTDKYATIVTDSDLMPSPGHKVEIVFKMPASDVEISVANAQKLIGTWQGSRHRKQYLAEGTLITDPHLVPNPPLGQWWTKGDRLTEHYSAVADITLRIVSVTDRELVTTDDAGHTFHAQRIPDVQAAQEKGN
jgi:hypothetical protein